MSKVKPADPLNPKKRRPTQAEIASNTVQMKGDPADESKLIAQLAVTPSLQGAATIKRWFGAVGERELDINALIHELSQQADTVSSGDLKREEAMLTIQAHTLDTIFNELARRSAANVGEYMGAAEVYMRLALKAQTQCRATIETLAEIKNPKPVAFVRQANISNGPQQVNNGGTTSAEPSRGENSKNRQSELLEQSDGERLEFGAKGAAVGANTPLETVGAVYRAENDGREGEGCPKRL
jgi:hypothetical protein